MEVPNQDAIRQTISNGDDGGVKEACNKAYHSPITNSQHNDRNIALSEELHQMQKRLAEIDRQTQTNPEGLIKANLIESIFKGKEIPNLPELDGTFPPYLNPSARYEYYGLEQARQKLADLLTNGNENVDPLQSYLQFESARLEIRHRQEKLVILLTQSATALQRPLRLGPSPSPSPVGASSRNTDGQPLTDDPDVKPLILHLDWLKFKNRGYAKSLEQSTIIIEVLNGEPTMAHTYGGSSYIHEKGPLPQFDNHDSAPKDPAIIGQSPLPERIRIRSNLLYRDFNEAEESHIPPPSTPIVMIRPFKFLSFYQNQLRELYKKLDAMAQEKMLSGASTPRTSDIGEIAGEAARKWHPFVVEEKIPPSPSRLAHLRCLLEFMDTTIIQKQNNLREYCNKVSFVDLWHLFKPGDDVLELGNEYMQCYKIVKVTSPRHKVIPQYLYPYLRSNGRVATTVSIHCVYVDFDGSVLGPVLKRFDIARYNGLKDITSLPVYPLSHAKNSTSIRQALIERGNKFLKALQVGHMHYNGLTLESRDEVDSQVVVDFTEALAYQEDHKNAGWKPKVQSRTELIRESIEDGDDGSTSSSMGITDHGGCDAECCVGEFVLDDDFVDQKQNEQFLSNLLSGTDEEESPASLAVVARTFRQDKIRSITDDDKVIMTYRVFGFILRNRSWAKLDIQELMDLEEYRRMQEKNAPTERNENAFHNLVFPNDGLDRKTIVRSLVAHHFRDKESGSIRNEQSDIIRGKGKGLIILLHGAPGVGKTTTAEGIAELFNRPLFQITCGDLGTTAREVETALETNFALANKWGSILLLDEADVFLARRTPQDFKRNGLVAVFLRVLEYYAGILFLTTNRIGDFDEAFSSRIHISLHYPALDYNSTIEIFELNWRLMKARFAHKKRTLDIDTGKITGFIADYWHNQKDARWNGRQIRNACQTALALAEFEAHGASMNSSRDPKATVHLGASHMETVANAYLEFIKYLQDVRDVDQEKYGWLMGIRRREGNGMAPEDPLAYNSFTSFRGSYTSPLAEHKSRFAAKYSRQEPATYQQGHSAPSTPDRQGYRYGAPFGASSPSLYQTHSAQPQRGGPSQPSPELLTQQGRSPRTTSGYYAGSQDVQQSPYPRQQAFPSQGQYGQHTQE